MSTPQDLVERAQEATGLSDLGASGWQDGLDRLVAAICDDLIPDEALSNRLEASLIGRLSNRLRIEQWYRQQPASPLELTGPVVIHGLPRTGTTALHFLLATGSTFRYQRRWEISDPVPPPSLATEQDDPRRQRAVQQARQAQQGSTRHISDVDGPVDDLTILGLDFHNQELGLPVPSYTRWWRGSDLSSTYAYHERVLRMLHADRPPHRWLVKAPYHNFHLAELAEQYPSALFVMTHRDPALAFPSACSTVANAQRLMLPERSLDPADLGAFLLEHLVDGIDRAMEARARIGEHRFLDVTQRELEDDASATAARVYEFLGLELDADTSRAMDEWAAANRRGSRGEHRYAAQEYGLTDERIRDAFSTYLKWFETRSGRRLTDRE
jgi:hypothetical protein